MPCLNVVVFMGNLTKDPELRYTPGGTAVATTDLAINRKYAGKDGSQKEEVTFIPLEAWARTAEVMSEYAKKGSCVAVEGRMRMETWEGKDGQKRSRLVAVVERCQLIGGKPDQKPATATAPAAPATKPPAQPKPPAQAAFPLSDPDPKVDDDIPF